MIMNIKEKIIRLHDRITIWAIHRFNVQLPDLLRTGQPVSGRIYYYYGRWLKLMPHTPEMQKRIREFRESHDMYLLDIPDDSISRIGQLNRKAELQQDISQLVCTSCPLMRIGLPCRKFYTSPSRTDDLCLTHHYQIIKGKNHAEEIITR